MKKIIGLLILISIYFVLISEESNIDPNFYDYGARAMAMGGAFTAISNTPVSLVWNPAGLSNLNKSHNLTFDNSSFLNLISYNFFGYGCKLNENFSVASGGTYSGDDALSEMTIYFSGAFNGNYLLEKFPHFPPFLKRISFGMNVKYFGLFFGNNPDGEYIDENGLNHQVKGSANGFGIDLGMQADLSDVQKIGLMWRNPINNIWWKSENEVGTALGDYSESYLAHLVFGYAFLKKKFIFSIDYDKSFHSDTEDEIKTGFEYTLFKMFSLRTGYSQELFTSENKKLSFGTGFKLNIINNITIDLDLAYQIFYVWEKHNVLRISCNLMK